MAMALASHYVKDTSVARPWSPCCLSSVFKQNRSCATYVGLKGFPAVKQNPVLNKLSTRQFSCLLRIVCAAAPETLEKVQKIVATQLAVEHSSVTPASKFSELGADSLDTVEIVMALEEEYKITIEDEGAEKIATVQDAADLIQDVISRQTSSV